MAQVAELNVFIIETELQLISYVAISKIENETNTLVFVTSQVLLEYLLSIGHRNVLLIDRSHKGGWIGKVRFLRRGYVKVERELLKSISYGDALKFFTPRIDSLYNNFIFAGLSSRFKIELCLIPDGAISFFSVDLSQEKKSLLKKWNMLFSALPFLKMKALVYEGDELGGDLANKVYCFGNVTMKYSEDKIRRISFPYEKGIESASSNVKVLVVGQNIQRYNLAPAGYISLVERKIADVVRDLKPVIIDYAKHPRSFLDEFKIDGSQDVISDALCVEQLIIQRGYTHILSCYSSALINAKLIAGDRIEAISVGLLDFPFADELQREQLLDVFSQLNIHVVPL